MDHRQQLRDLIFMQATILHPLDSLGEYFEEFSRHANNLKSHAESVIDSGNEDGIEDWYRADKIIIKQLNYTMLTSVYSIVEMGLDRLCTHIAKQRQLTVAIDDFHGKGVVRALNYLKKACGVEIDNNTNEYLLKLNCLRNCVVHGRGFYKGKALLKKVENLVKNDPLLRDEGMSLVLRDDFIKDMLPRVKKVFENLVENLNGKI